MNGIWSIEEKMRMMRRSCTKSVWKRVGLNGTERNEMVIMMITVRVTRMLYLISHDGDSMSTNGLTDWLMNKSSSAREISADICKVELTHLLAGG